MGKCVMLSRRHNPIVQSARVDSIDKFLYRECTFFMLLWWPILDCMRPNAPIPSCFIMYLVFNACVGLIDCRNMVLWNNICIMIISF